MKINWPHYVVECVAIVMLGAIAFGALSVGIYELPLYLAIVGGVVGIAAWDIHKKSKES